jgi:hypothetical protein
MGVRLGPRETLVEKPSVQLLIVLGLKKSKPGRAFDD